VAEVGIIYTPLYLEHLTGRNHPEQPARLEAIMERLAPEIDTQPHLKIYCPCENGTTVAVLQVHSREHVNHVKEVSERGGGSLDSDTPISGKSYEAALAAVGAGLKSVELLKLSECTRTFCGVRPPGHHAERDHAMGFCLFNNVAACTRYAQKVNLAQRIYIMDWDVHHGNGTQHIFYSDPNVFYFSIHQMPHYPGTGYPQERGEGQGYGATLNCPVPPGSGDDEYRRILRERFLPSVQQFNPELFIVSAGFDAHIADPLGSINLSTSFFGEMTEVAVEAARQHCDGMVISMLEGGYNLNALADSAAAHVNALLSD